MTFHFQCDLSPALTNAGVSRFLITTIPSTLHLECANITLGFPVYWPSASKGSLCRLQFSTVGHFPQVRSMSTAKRVLEGGQIPYPCRASLARYIYDEQGTNLTLQAAARSITDSMNQLSTCGVRIRDRAGEEALLPVKKKHVWAGYNPGSTYLVQGVLND